MIGGSYFACLIHNCCFIYSVGLVLAISELSYLRLVLLASHAAWVSCCLGLMLLGSHAACVSCCLRLMLLGSHAAWVSCCLRLVLLGSHGCLCFTMFTFTIYCVSHLSFQILPIQYNGYISCCMCRITILLFLSSYTLCFGLSLV